MVWGSTDVSSSSDVWGGAAAEIELGAAVLMICMRMTNIGRAKCTACPTNLTVGRASE